MELIDDWAGLERLAATPAGRGKAVPPATPEAIEAELEGFDPEILTVHCYEDVGYPWVQVVFDEVITPAIALAVGDALARAAGAENVYLNSLRPQAVYFLLEPAFAPQPDLVISRYGAQLEAIRSRWESSQG